MSGGGELTAALFQELSRQWPVHSRSAAVIARIGVLSFSSCARTSKLLLTCVQDGSSAWAGRHPVNDCYVAMLQGNKDYQSLRLQLTSGYKDEANTIETLSYSADVLDLPPAGGSSTGGREDDHDHSM